MFCEGLLDKNGKERLEKLKLLTIADKNDPNYEKAKKARKEDILRCQIRLIAERADKVHTQPRLGLWVVGWDFWEGYTDWIRAEQWCDFKGSLDRLIWKVKVGARLEPEDWEALRDAAKEYQLRPKKKKRQVIVDAVLNICDFALAAKETPEQDEALIDFYKREQRGELAAASFVEERSHPVPRSILGFYTNTKEMYVVAFDALEKTDDYILGLPGDKGKAAYEKAWNDFAEKGKEKSRDRFGSAMIGRVAAATKNLKPAENEDPVLTHAKIMFPHMLRLLDDLDRAESPWSNSLQYEVLCVVADDYKDLMLDVITCRKGKVAADKYYDEFELLRRAAKDYLTMKLELGEMSADEKDAFIENLKKFEPSDYIGKQYEDYKKNKKSKEYRTYKRYKDVLRDESTKRKVNLALDILRLKPFKDTNSESQGSVSLTNK